MITKLLSKNNLKSIDSADAANAKDMLIDVAEMLNELSFYAGTPDSEPSVAKLAEAASLSSELLIAARHFDVLSQEATPRGE